MKYFFFFKSELQQDTFPRMSARHANVVKLATGGWKEKKNSVVSGRGSGAPPSLPILFDVFWGFLGINHVSSPLPNLSCVITISW